MRMRLNANLTENVCKLLNKNGTLVLLFHGVVNKKKKTSVRNYTSKHIGKDSFYNILQKCKSLGNCISIDELYYFIKERKKIPPYSFVITFDDGFQNNLSIAAPIIADLGLHFTIYLTSNFIDKNKLSWTDQLEYGLEHTKNKAIFFNKQEINIESSLRKKIFAHNIRILVKKSKEIDPYELIKKINKSLNIYNFDLLDSQLDKKINWEDIQKFSEEKFITFGGHSHTHNNLDFLSKNKLQEEIKTNLDMLKDKANLDCKHYAYPEGGKNSFSERVIKVLKSYKVLTATTTINGINKNTTNPFKIKRYMIS
tara:strand:+ start:975 stop:1907 length:933 start_codon:yes stop_codon:yes gene_type:complete